MMKMLVTIILVPMHGLELEQGPRGRSVPQWVATTDLQKMNNLLKCKKK